MEPTPNQNDAIAQGVGQVLGELIKAFSAAFQALRSQPGFDADSFDEQIQTLIESPDATTLQKHAWQLILSKQEDAADV